MANWYKKTKGKIGSNTIDLSSLNDPKIIAIEDGLYTFSQNHEFLDDVPSGARIATQDLANVTWNTVSDAVLDADNVVFPTPTAGKDVIGFVIYDDDGVAEASSPLLCFIDNSSDLPIATISGRDLNCNFPAEGIAEL